MESSTNSAVRTISLSQHLSQQSKSFAVESDGLLIAEVVLQSHLDQLPVGLPVGDYRIVDSLGGVGWLRVRLEGSEIAAAGDRRMLSTSVGDETVRFIQVDQTTLGHANGSIIR